MMAMFLAYMPPPHHGLQPLTIQGKVAELRLELNSGGKKDKNFNQKKVALKKIVATYRVWRSRRCAYNQLVIQLQGRRL